MKQLTLYALMFIALQWPAISIVCAEETAIYVGLVKHTRTMERVKGIQVKAFYQPFALTTLRKPELLATATTNDKGEYALKTVLNGKHPSYFSASKSINGEQLEVIGLSGVLNNPSPHRNNTILVDNVSVTGPRTLDSHTRRSVINNTKRLLDR